MGQDADPQEDRTRRTSRAAGTDSHGRRVIGDSSEAFLLGRIVELEEKVRALKAELAKRDAAAAINLQIDPAGERHDVTADGTRGMERGVSQRGSRASRRGDAGG